jgi:hypothetical protein
MTPAAGPVEPIARKTLTVPPPAGEPPDLERLVAAAAESGIEILGPPGMPG